MLKLTNGTTVRDTPSGLIAIRGKRELHMLYKTAKAGKRARELLATKSFDALFKAGKATRLTGPSIRYIRFNGDGTIAR